jgi:hypothetical protein
MTCSGSRPGASDFSLPKATSFFTVLFVFSSFVIPRLHMRIIMPLRDKRKPFPSPPQSEIITQRGIVTGALGTFGGTMGGGLILGRIVEMKTTTLTKTAPDPPGGLLSAATATAARQ